MNNLDKELRSYVAGLAAIHSTSVEVVEVCRALVVEQLSTLSSSLGVTAEAKDIKADLLPAKLQQFEEGWAWIGVTIALVPKKLWFCLGLHIDETDESEQHVGAHASFYVETLEKATSIFTSLSGASGRTFELDDEDYGVSTSEPVPDDALGSYKDALTTAVQRWVGEDGGKPLFVVAKHMDLLRQ
jgi:hypothetical protein